MHRRGGHRPAGTACSGLVGGQQNGSSMGARLCKTEVVVTASAGKEEPTLPLSVARPAELAAGTLHGHTRPQRPPLTDRPHYYTPHHHFPTLKLRKHKPSTRCAQLGPLCGWLQSRSCAPLARVALCPPTCATSIALQRGGGTDARCPMAASRRRQPRCHMERVQVAAHAHPLLVALCEGQAGEGRFIQGPQRCAVITSGWELS